MKFLKSLLLLLIIFFIFVPVAFSYANANQLPVVSVINPIRYPQLQKAKGNQLASLKDQWQVTHDAGINATWLWQYSTLEDKQLTDFAKSQMRSQEFGLFLEVDRNFAAKAHVLYRGQGPWYFSDGLLLVSYDQAERRKLIDTAFAKFKDVFGYYPKTVGAWWVGADSIGYMQQKYAVVATLKASDQFNLDAYSIWGTPWSIPYVSAAENAGVPAGSLADSSKVVTLQWAARDPLRAYGSSSGSSLYSLQDSGDIAYFKYLLTVYLREPLDQVAIGLEDDLPAGSYQYAYRERLLLIKQLEENGKVNVLLAKDYAQRFLAQNKTLPPTNYFLSKDYETNDQSFWFNGTNFRAGIQKIQDNIFLVDLRNYANKTVDDFETLPNSQGLLRISEPAVIDSVRLPGQRLLIGKSNDALRVKNSPSGIEIFAGSQEIALFTPTKLQLFDLNSKIFDFTPPQKSIGVFWIWLVIFIVYFLLVFRRFGNLSKTVGQAILLSIPLLLAYPFLSTQQGFLFDKKELVLFLLPAIHVLPFSLRTTLVFQVIPFILLLLLHFFFYVRSKKSWMKLIYYVYLGLLVLFYAHIFYFPLDRSTYAIVFGILAGLALTLLILIIAVVYKKRTFRILFASVFTALLFLGLVVVVLLFSRQKFIIAPFEAEALNMIESNGKQVLFIYPSGYSPGPIYKAVRPLLYDYTKFGEKLTATHWQKIVRDGYAPLKFSTDGNSWVFVPKYLGADLSDKEISDNGLVKVFDNAQIAIFAKK